MVPAPIAPGWQHPFVDVLKLCDRETELKGEVTEHMDKIIGKKVYKVRGTIPAANYLRLPKLKAQNLGLTGRFLYIQVKVTPVKVFVIHLEVQTQDQNVHRISISSMYRTESLQRKSNGIQIPFTQSSHRWCIMAVDLVTALRKYTTSPLSCLRSAQLCSWLTLRALFTSDLKFSLQTLPRDMALSHALDSSLFEFVWLPQEPLDVGCADIMPVSRRVTADKRPSSSSSSAGGGGHGPAPGLCPPLHSPPAASHGLPPAFTMSATAGLMSDAAQALALQLQHTAALASVPAAVPGPHNSTGANMRQQVLPPQQAWSETWPTPLAPSAGQGGGAPGAGPPLPGKADRPALLKGRQQVGARPGGAVQGLLLEPDTALTLVRVNAFQGEFARSLVWPPHSDELVFTASSVIVAMAAQAGGAQRFFLGHTAPVVALAFDGEGRLMASAQDGRQAVIRVWDFRSRQCLAILNGHASGMLGLDVSADGRALLGIGQDSACRQLMVLWDISHLRSGGKPTILAQSTTEYNIKVARFSAYEEDHLVTAGRDNVRMYRLKAGQLRGVTVRTGAPSKQVTTYKGVISAALGPNIFTDIAFESSAGVYSLDNRHVFVSSASGSVFEIDYNSRTLLCVYQLHSAAINSIIVHDGFCVTGSDDKQLRVWPMNFSDFLLEAEHEAGVTSVSVAHDGLRVAIGTESGALGVLDIPSHAFTTLLRSHTGSVNAVAADPCRPEYCTVSSDGTIRIWDLATHQQLVEFDAPGEVVTCVAYHPRQQELATGFANGRVRVFDVASTTLLQEHLQHRAEVLQVAYSPDGSRLYSAGADGGLCVFDVAQVYAPIKFLSAGKRDVRVCLAVSNDGRYIATVSQDASRGITSLLLFHGTTLEPYMRIETDGTIVRRLAFSPDGCELWVLADTTRLDRYELVEGQLLQQVDEAHRLDINSLAVDPGARFLATAGNDGLVKLWAVVPRTADVGLLQGAVPDHQAFSGHPSAVLDCTLAHDHLVTVGEGESVFIWRVNPPTHPPTPAPTLPRPGTPPQPALIQQAGALPGSLAPLALGNRPPDVARQLGIAGGQAGLADVSQAARPPQRPATRTQGPAGGNHRTSPGRARMPSSSSSPPPGQPAPPGARSHVANMSAQLGSDPSAPHAVCHAALGYTPNEMAQNVVWLPASGLFAYAAGPLVVVEELATRTQRLLSRLAHPVAALAASPDSKLLAVAGAAPESSQFAEVVVWAAASGACLAVLQYHPVAVELLSFSWCSRYLVSAGRAPERSLVVWDLHPLTTAHPPTSPPTHTPHAWPPSPSGGVGGEVGGAGLLPLSLQPLCVGRTRAATVGLAWLPPPPPTSPSAPLHRHPPPSQRTPASRPPNSPSPSPAPDVALAAVPRFASVGGDGLLLWSLHPSHLEQLPLSLPPAAPPGPPLRPPLSEDRQGNTVAESLGEGEGQQGPTAATAVGVDADGVLVVAGEGGSVWEVRLLEQQQAVAMQLVANLSPGHITRISVGQGGAVLGLSDGVVAAFRRSAVAGAVWARATELHLPGCVTSLCCEPLMAEAVVATSRGAIWYLDFAEACKAPLVAGHSAPVTCITSARQPAAAPAGAASGWSKPEAPGGHGPQLVVLAAEDGEVRLWRLQGVTAEAVASFQAPGRCTCAALLPWPRGPARGDVAGSPRLHPPGPDSSSGLWRAVAGYADGSLRLLCSSGALDHAPDATSRSSRAAPDQDMTHMQGGGDGQGQEAACLWHSPLLRSPVVTVVPHPRKPLLLCASRNGELAVVHTDNACLKVHSEHFVSGSRQQQLQMADMVAALGGAAGGLDPPLCGLDVSWHDASVCAAAWSSHMVVFSTPWEDSVVDMLACYKCEEPAMALSTDVPAVVQFIPHSTKVLAYSSPLLLGKVLLFDYRLARVVQSVAVPELVGSLAASPNGLRLALGGMAGSVYLVDCEGGCSTRLQPAGRQPVQGVMFNRGGDALLSAAGACLLVWGLSHKLVVTKQDIMRAKLL